MSRRRAKIIATIGPSSNTIEMLEKMIKAGVDLCRINSSHGDHEMMERIIKTVRQINESLQTHTAILFDLQGPKIRIGDLMEPTVMLIEGE